MVETGIGISALLIGLTLLMAKVGEDLVRRVGLPSFVGAIISGIILGPAVINLVNPNELPYIQLFIILGINFLLFIAGSEELSGVFREKPLLKDIAYSVVLLTLPASFVTLVVYYMFSQDLTISISIGIIMGIVGMGPLIKTLLETGKIDTPSGIRLVTLGLLAETIGIIVFNAIEEKITGAIISVSVTFVFLVLLYFLGKKFFPKMLHYVERFSWAGEAPFAVIIALILTTGYLAEILGFNAAVTSLLLGLFAAEYLRERPDHMEKLKGFTYGFFEPLFFAGIGLFASTISLYSLLASLVLIAVAAVPKLGVLKLFLPKEDNRFLFLILSKGGVDAALLATLVGIKKEGILISGELYSAGVLAIIGLALLSSFPFRSYTMVSSGVSKSFWGRKVSDLKLLPIYVDIKEKLKIAARLLADYPSIIVLKNMEPVGILTQSDLIYIEPEFLGKLNVSVLEPFKPVPIIYEDESVYSAVTKMYERDANVVAVVDKNGKIKGALYAREVLDALSEEKLVKDKDKNDK